MPGSGTPLLWNESSPAETDIADAAPIRSLETSIRNGLAVEHNWPSASGPNFGYHLPGSARAYYDVESNVSSSGTDGRIMVTSDTSRLFHVGSAGTMFLGGSRVLSAGSAPPGGQNFYWAEEFGAVGVLSASGTVTYPNSGFSGVPFTYLSYASATAGGIQAVTVVVFNPTNLTFGWAQFNADGSGRNSAGTINWRSIGTRVL